MKGSAVVVPNLNGEGIVGRCVTAALAAGAAEVVVVDDGSADESPGEAAQAGARLLRSPGRGFAAAVNAGVAATEADYVLVLNSDCFLEPSALDALGSALSARPAVTICGARLVNANGAPAKSYGAAITLRTALGTALTGRGAKVPPAAGNGIQVVPFVPLACALIRRAAWDAVGGLDERFFFYFEDHDLCWRFSRTGGQVAICWEARALHVGGASSSARDPQGWLRQYHESQARYLRKRYRRAWLLYAVVFVPTAVARSIAWLVRGRPRWASAWLRSVGTVSG